MSKKTCLVVDDSPLVRQLLKFAIEGQGLAVDEAEDGILAFAKCVVSMPDVIFIDWNMPRMDGMELLRKIRAYDGGDKPTIIFCTVEDKQSCINMAKNNGADEYIVKPFDRQMIATTLRQLGVISTQ
jgi:two-component system chemotaxis response regulator CheY